MSEPIYRKLNNIPKGYSCACIQEFQGKLYAVFNADGREGVLFIIDPETCVAKEVDLKLEMKK